jgi:hypothetical protein
MALERLHNPLLQAQESLEVNLPGLDVPMALHRRKHSVKRDHRALMRKETATQAVAGLTQDLEIYGFTKGQFGLIELLGALLAITGPAFLTISTWTVAHAEVAQLIEMREQGKVTGTRWLVDFSLQRRDPGMAQQIRQAFGADAIRVAQSHAKFYMVQNAAWDLVMHTSMNFNMNPRTEDFFIGHDPELAAFLETILQAVWTRQSKDMATERPYTIVKHWQNEI